ncbi:MAG: Hpt domain-containing protein [Oscillatoriales cyanobacterium]|nr:MAG: Hpt domain-containing protein [Oscillatoriales cyanobacterium]
MQPLSLTPKHLDPSPPNTPQFPGLVIQAGLQRMGDDWEGYGELLQLFTTTYRSFDQDCESLIDRGEYAQAKDILHTLKGAAGNIGAEDLMQVADTLEQELGKDPIVPDRVVAQFLVTLREFYQVLNSIDAVTHHINSTRPFDE